MEFDLDNIECVSTSDGMDEDDAHNHHPFSTKSGRGGAGAGAGGAPAGAGPPPSSVHELLECPVCTNSMYPPIHQIHNGRSPHQFTGGPSKTRSNGNFDKKMEAPESQLAAHMASEMAVLQAQIQTKFSTSLHLICLI